MRKLFMLSVICIAALSAAAQNDSDKEPYTVKKFSGDAVSNVKVKTSGGSISVQSAPAGQERIEVYVRGNNDKNLSKGEIQQRLNEDYNLDIAVSNHQLTAIAKQKTMNMNWKKSLSISFKIYTQSKVATDLNTSGGSISIDGLQGEQTFSTSGGSLSVKNITGDVDGSTSGGSISVSGSSGNLDLSTSGGSISAQNNKGKMQLKTSGGSLNLEKLDGTIEASTSGGSVNGSGIYGQLQASTSGGSVDLSDLYCSVEASTSGGGMNVEIKQLGKYVKLENSAGHIHVSLPDDKGITLDLKGDKIKTNHLNNFQGGGVDDDHITGKLNGGGIPVSVHAGSGHIDVTFL